MDTEAKIARTWSEVWAMPPTQYERVGYELFGLLFDPVHPEPGQDVRIEKEIQRRLMAE